MYTVVLLEVNSSHDVFVYLPMEKNKSVLMHGINIYDVIIFVAKTDKENNTKTFFTRSLQVCET